MSHLMIVIDEFAQLKEQARQAMVSIKEMARIGRSLGIHLILSTQKPMGIIDEQIWANTSFHICMKVNSKQDSMEVLHNDFAYHLKEPGQFILQRQSCVKGHSFIFSFFLFMECFSKCQFSDLTTFMYFLCISACCFFYV